MWKKLTSIAICILLTLLTITGCNKNMTSDDKQGYQAVIKTARAEIYKKLLDGSNTNVSIAVMDNDKIVYSEYFGIRDIENSIPVDNNTQFNIGSLSKMFATTAIMVLCDQGKVELDKPVITYLPEFTMKDIRYKDITVRMLLNHTSGLPGSNYKNSLTTIKDQNFVTETLSYLAESKLKSKPGEISVYCNDGFIVAQAIVEKLSGTSYSDFLDKNVFSKLSMQNSSVCFKDNNSNIAITLNHSKGAPNPKECMSSSGSGGIASTVEDLCRFGTAFYSDATFFNSKSLEELQKPQYGSKTVPKGVPYDQYGLGWDTIAVDEFQKQNVIVLDKEGATLQYNASLYVAPKEKLVVAIIIGGSDTVQSINTKVMQCLLESKGIVKKIEDKKTLSLKTVEIPGNIFSYKGYYQMKNNFLKVDFDKQSNTFNLYNFVNGAFVNAKSAEYKEDGYFYDTDGTRYAFLTNYDTKFINAYLSDSTEVAYTMEGIKQGTGTLQPSNFDNRVWISRNTGFGEQSMAALAKTLRNNDFPNYVIYNIMNGYNISELVDKDTTKMVLQFTRDLYEPRIITDNGSEVLKMGNYEFVDASKIDTLKTNTKVVIDQNGYNQCRIVDKDTVFKCNIGDNARVVVLSSGGTSSYDSIYDGVKEIVINKGSYVLFIGSSGYTFEPEVTQ